MREEAMEDGSDRGGSREREKVAMARKKGQGKKRAATIAAP